MMAVDRKKEIVIWFKKGGFIKSFSSDPNPLQQKQLI